MSVDIQPKDGRWHLSLGPIERWIVTVVALLLMALLGYFFSSALTKLDKTSDSINQLTNQVSVVQSQLQTMNTQLADVPALKLEVAKHAVQIEQNNEDSRELKQTRGLK